MKHSKSHITLYFVYIIISWGGKVVHGLESLTIIFLSEYIAYLSPPSFGILTIILWSSCIDTCNNNFRTNFVSKWPSIETLRRYFLIGDCTTWGWCIIQLQIPFSTCSLFFISSLLCDTKPQHIYWSDFLGIWFSIT